MRRLCYVVAVLLIATGVLFAGGKQEGTGEPGDTVLRIASAIQGPEEIRIYNDLVAEFEANHPGTRVEWDRSTGDDYQFTGLPSLLESDTPPDIYFEWGGNRVAEWAADGYALDITDLADELRPIINESAWAGSEHEGATYLIPDNQDITIMMWYNVDLFNRYGLAAPDTWDEFLAVGEVLLENGVTPIVMGNADAWVAGNFIGVFLSRWAGDDYTHRVLSLEPGTALNNPRFIEALQFAYELGRRGFINSDVNTLGYEDSFARLFNESAAIYPLGTWFTDEVVNAFAEDPEKANFDYFDVPSFAGGAGDPDSVMGLNTGWLVNANTENRNLAYDFLRLLLSEKYQSRFIDIGRISTNTTAMNGSDDPYIRQVARTLDSTPVLISPPDTGYDLEMASALYEAIAKVIEGIDPATALAEAENKVQFLR
ncbi:MAG: extracellular solute-binding protein [Alkalispirochaeta sp.]